MSLASPTLRDKDNAAAKMKQINVPTSYDSRKFRELISNQCPSYELVVSFLRGEMRLFILALEKVADEIGDSVCINAENTGIGSVLANKVRTFSAGRIRSLVQIQCIIVFFSSCRMNTIREESLPR